MNKLNYNRKLRKRKNDITPLYHVYLSIKFATTPSYLSRCGGCCDSNKKEMTTDPSKK